LRLHESVVHVHAVVRLAELRIYLVAEVPLQRLRRQATSNRQHETTGNGNKRFALRDKNMLVAACQTGMRAGNSLQRGQRK
jgi:hypothetical protein